MVLAKRFYKFATYCYADVGVGWPTILLFFTACRERWDECGLILILILVGYGMTPVFCSHECHISCGMIRIALFFVC